MLVQTVDLERIRGNPYWKVEDGSEWRRTAALGRVFGTYVDKLRTDNAAERTIIGMWTLKGYGEIFETE